MTFKVDIGDWDNLAPGARQVRLTVFVAEQRVPESLEWDEFDALSRHALVCVQGQPIATGRLLPDGHIGRMAVLAPWRGQGVGGAVLDSLMAEAWRLGMGSLRLHAQRHALGFYGRRGFVAVGAEFMEAGIPHCLMALDPLKAPPAPPTPRPD